MFTRYRRCWQALTGAAMLLAAVLGPAASAHGATDLETLDRQVARSAVDNPFGRPRALCVCHDGSELDDSADVLIHSSEDIARIGDLEVNTVRVLCAVMGFDTGTGAQVRSGGCTPFEILPR